MVYQTNQQKLVAYFKDRGFSRDSFKPKQIISDISDNFDRTNNEFLVFLGCAAMAGLIYGNHAEHLREYKRPLSFSEITQIRRDAEFNGGEVNPRTVHHAGTMDMLNKIFESSNTAHKKSRKKDIMHSFAIELDMRMDPAIKYHTNNLADFLASTPIEARRYIDTLSEYTQVMEGVYPIAQSFDNAWAQHSYDSTREEEVCTKDSNDNEVCTTETVCVSTTYTYSFYPQNALRGENAMDSVILAHPDLKYTLKAQLASKTNAEGEMAAEVSRENDGEYLKLSQAELHDIANKFHYGSTLTQNLPIVHSNWGELNSDSVRWDQIKGNAASEADEYSNTTCCDCGDSGPISYQISEQIADHARNVYKSIDEILEGPRTVFNMVPKLKTKVEKIINIELNYQPGDSEELMVEILDDAAEIYYKNFKDGYDVEGYRWWMVGLYGFGAAMAGLALGAGLDFLGDRFGIWTKLGRIVRKE